MKIKEAQVKSTTKEVEGCTFAPKINNWKFSKPA